MSTRWLSEQTVLLIQDAVRTNISQALVDVRTQRNDAKVQTDPPQSYFIYEGARGYRCPAIFTIIDSMEMLNADRGANHINARAHVIVAVLVEDRIQTNLTYKAWRYQSALHNVLHQTVLTSSDNRVKLVVKVDRIVFGPEFSESTDTNKPSGVFRKEVALHLEVEHYESF